MSKEFRGPIFIVGMSRSGTKLLRDILNNSNEVAIPSFESHFIPYLVDNFTEKFPLNGEDAREFKELIKNSIFYNEITKDNKYIGNIDLDKITSQKDLQSAVKSIILLLTPQKKDTKVWGDKTPNNMLHMVKLKRAFPSAKFVHIIRDPRERALSTKKAWGTSIVSSAERWRKGVTKARAQGVELGDDYAEITYEELTARPEHQIKRICKFIDIKYSSTMTQLTRSAEVYKTAKNNTMAARSVLSGNVEKYKEWFSAKEISQIEDVCGDTLTEFGYVRDTMAQQRHYRLSTAKKIYIKVHDSIMTTLFHVRRWGLVKGIKYLLWRKKVTI